MMLFAATAVIPQANAPMTPLEQMAQHGAQFGANAAPKLEPMHHFQVHDILPIHLFGVDLSISNSVIWMWIAVAAAFAFFHLSSRNAKTIPSRWQSLAEMGFLFIQGVINDIIGKDGKRFFPIIFTLFYFILFCNLMGLIPGSFSVTAQIIVTGTLAVGVFLFSTGLGFYKHGLHFTHFFVPAGVPVFLMPLVVPIEIISFLARPISLMVRLFANMTAGHTVITLMLFFTITLPWFSAWLPFSFAVLILGAEIFIGFIQAYIFTVLTCIYINDALHMH